MLVRDHEPLCCYEVKCCTVRSQVLGIVAPEENWSLGLNQLTNINDDLVVFDVLDFFQLPCRCKIEPEAKAGANDRPPVMGKKLCFPWTSFSIATLQSNHNPSDPSTLYMMPSGREVFRSWTKKVRSDAISVTRAPVDRSGYPEHCQLLYRDE